MKNCTLSLSVLLEHPLGEIESVIIILQHPSENRGAIDNISWAAGISIYFINFQGPKIYTRLSNFWRLIHPMRFSNGVYRPDLISPYFTLCTFSSTPHIGPTKSWSASALNHWIIIGRWKQTGAKSARGRFKFITLETTRLTGLFFAPQAAKGERVGGLQKERRSRPECTHMRKRERERVCVASREFPRVTQCTACWHTLSHPTHLHHVF